MSRTPGFGLRVERGQERRRMARSVSTHPHPTHAEEEHLEEISYEQGKIREETVLATYSINYICEEDTETTYTGINLY